MVKPFIYSLTEDSGSSSGQIYVEGLYVPLSEIPYKITLNILIVGSEAHKALLTEQLHKHGTSFLVENQLSEDIPYGTIASLPEISTQDVPLVICVDKHMSDYVAYPFRRYTIKHEETVIPVLFSASIYATPDPDGIRVTLHFSNEQDKRNPKWINTHMPVIESAIQYFSEYLETGRWTLPGLRSYKNEVYELTPENIRQEIAIDSGLSERETFVPETMIASAVAKVSRANIVTTAASVESSGTYVKRGRHGDIVEDNG